MDKVFFSWSDELSVGVEAIDNQHKHLIGLINKLHDAMSQGKGKEVLGQTLGELIDYTKTHFAAEEKLMEQYDYSSMYVHKGEHNKLTNQVLDFQAQFSEGKAMLSMNLMNFLSDWLNKHIKETDKRFGKFLISRMK